MTRSFHLYIFIILILLQTGCASTMVTRTELPDGSVDEEWGVPFRANNGTHLVTEIGGDRIYYVPDSPMGNCLMRNKMNFLWQVHGGHTTERVICLQQVADNRWQIVVVGNPQHGRHSIVSRHPVEYKEKGFAYTAAVKMISR